MRMKVILLTLALALVAPAAAKAGPDYQLPNLAPLNPYDVHIDFDDSGTGVKVVRFSTSVANRGEYPFDLLGVEHLDNSGPDDAYECVHWVTRVCTGREYVGTFQWNDSHQHFHLDNFARYQLRTLGSDGKPDMSPTGLIAEQHKVSFCMIDESQDSSFTLGVQDLPFYRSCDGYLQGISPGWSDDYGYVLQGQYLPLPPDGNYAVVIVINPDGKFLDAPTGDNTSYTAFQISNSGKKLTVL